MNVGKSSGAPWWATWMLCFVGILLVWTADPVSTAIDAATQDPLPVGALLIRPGDELGLVGWSPSFACPDGQPAEVTLLAYAQAGCSLRAVIAPADWAGLPQVSATPPAQADDGGLPWVAILVVLFVVGGIVGGIWLMMSRARAKETSGGRVAWPRKAKPVSATTDIEAYADEVIGG